MSTNIPQAEQRENREVYHWRIKPSSATALTERAAELGVPIGYLVEQAIASYLSQLSAETLRSER